MIPRSPAAAAAVLALSAAASCSAPAPSGAEAPAAKAPAAAPVRASGQEIAGSVSEAPAGVAASPGDAWKPQPTGDVVATVRTRLLRGLEEVEEQPRPMAVPLGPAPGPGVDVTGLAPGTWLHGAMPVTRTETVPFAARGDRGMVILDSDRDGKLEAGEELARADNWGNLAWFAGEVAVRQVRDGKTLQAPLPVRIGINLAQAHAAARIDGRREAVVKAGGRDVRIAIVDRTGRGWFSHPGIDALMVDVDGDGRFDPSPDSAERYRLGEPFPAGDQDLVVKEVGPFGTTLTIAKSTKPALRKASLRIGTAGPEWSVKTIEGKPLSSKSLKGKWVLLDFWATWCGPCRNELPHLKELRKQHPDLVIVGVSGDQTEEAVTTFTKAQGMDWPQVFSDARPLMQQFRVSVFPTSFLIAPDGTIAARDLRGAATSAQVTSLKQKHGA